VPPDQGGFPLPLAVRWSQSLPGHPSSITISKDRAGRYVVSYLCEKGTEAMPVVPKTTGVDLGLKDLFVTSAGFKSANPKYTNKCAAKLAYLQRQLAKKAKGTPRSPTAGWTPPTRRPGH